MPGIPLVVRETSYSRSADQMCRQDSHVHLSAEEEFAAEESLSIYCKPVELYNILQRRAVKNPSFLQRCLRYKLQAKHKRRIHMTVSLSVNDGLQTQSLFPIYVLLARLVCDAAVAECSAAYSFSRACVLTAPNGGNGLSAQAYFILPEINKLAGEVKAGSLVILLVSHVDMRKVTLDKTSFPSNVQGACLLGKIPMDSLYLSWEKSLNFSLGHRAEMMSTVDLCSCFLKSSCWDEAKCISVEIPHDASNMEQQVQVIICAEEVGAKEKSPYTSYAYNDIPTSSLSHIIRLRSGNVIFNYRYYNNKLQRTEVTEDFTCPFCLVKCASFKGLRSHLPSSHDLFNFEFWVTEEYQAVNVSVKSDITKSEIVADGVDPKQQTFFFRSKPVRHRKSKKVAISKNVHPLVLDCDSAAAGGEGFSKVFLERADDALSSKAGKAHLHSENDLRMGSSSATGCMEHITSANITRICSVMAQSHADLDCAQSAEGNLAPPTMLQFAKTRKLSMERFDSRNRSLLQKRQFFHSHRAQPMALEQVLLDRDSEDEVDDDVADFEDRRMLDDFVDVTKDEKQMMHLWNSFVRKQRVLADGHIPWACEAFSRLHAHDLVQAPSLVWCWRLFMIKLWNHGLLDARTLNNCNIILDQCQINNVVHTNL